MIAKQKPLNQTSLFFSFGSTLDQKHPIFVLANKIDWAVLIGHLNPCIVKIMAGQASQFG